MIWLDCFTDPILRGPTIGSMLMCLVAALVGVIVLIRRHSLLGEALSHATYPGVGGAIVLAGIFSWERALPICLLVGAFLTTLGAVFLIYEMKRRLRLSDDASLCFVLSLFFGIGVTIASFAQNRYTYLFRQIQTYLYGQAATMTDFHVMVYGCLALCVIASLSLSYRKILAFCFDPLFTYASGISSGLMRFFLVLLTVTAVVVGIRSVGVILMSAMLIAPAAAARQFTNRLFWMFVFSGIFGVSSGFLGTYLSVIFPAIPTGPMIVLVAGSIALYALLFAPERGLLIRYGRVARFRTLQMQENLLKLLWRLDQKKISFKQIAQGQRFSKWRLRFLLFRLCQKGWLKKEGTTYELTPLGVKKGGQIVRLHRLWEVYLVHSLGLGVERVHKSAEEMEHILTPELEEELTRLLNDPKQDPHEQPIPSRDEVMSHG